MYCTPVAVSPCPFPCSKLSQDYWVIIQCSGWGEKEKNPSGWGSSHFLRWEKSLEVQVSLTLSCAALREADASKMKLLFLSSLKHLCSDSFFSRMLRPLCWSPGLHKGTLICEWLSIIVSVGAWGLKAPEHHCDGGHLFPSIYPGCHPEDVFHCRKDTRLLHVSLPPESSRHFLWHSLLHVYTPWDQWVSKAGESVICVLWHCDWSTACSKRKRKEAVLDWASVSNSLHL